MAEPGYDPARLPPGQYLTEKWPVLHAGDVPDADLTTLGLPRLGRGREPDPPCAGTSSARSPRSEVTQDIHCVTRWSRFDTTFEGVPWSALAGSSRRSRCARYAIAHAEQGYTANVPIAFLARPLALLATHADGEPLTPEHGWPLRLVIPGKYFWKSAKWLRGIELTAADKPGFWERYGYHNDADPWEEQRYGF